MITVLKPIAFDVVTYMTQLFDYYLYSVSSVDCYLYLLIDFHFLDKLYFLFIYCVYLFVCVCVCVCVGGGGGGGMAVRALAVTIVVTSQCWQCMYQQHVLAIWVQQKVLVMASLVRRGYMSRVVHSTCQ